ncbi:MAG: flagellar protein export ATPase FliI [Christensenellales bacterium]|jgi:flagellum-specific ATP synthase
MINVDWEKFRQAVKHAEPYSLSGKVLQVVGLTVEASGSAAKMGDQCRICSPEGEHGIEAEVVGFRDDKLLLMPLGSLTGVGRGSWVQSMGRARRIPVGRSLTGRVLDGLGTPMDGGGPLEPEACYPVENSPPNPLSRKRIRDVTPLGIRAIDALLTVGQGQRIGVFAGSGVGKSKLLGMIARNSTASVNVIALVGERGREVREFIEKDLQEQGLKKSIVVVATSDQPALVRLKSAMVGTAIAEYFRDQGENVLLMMDSLTRFAMAQREIGMAIGEPPVARGYTPSVYALLPKLLERTGTSEKGAITGLYTVLVEGDDMNEPVSDTVRGILDGHIVLSRELANAGHYPAIDVLSSVSRVMPDIVDKEHMRAADCVKNNMAVYRRAQDLINIGAYKKGTDAVIDRAIDMIGPINAFLRQSTDEPCAYDATKSQLMELIRGSDELA